MTSSAQELSELQQYKFFLKKGQITEAQSKGPAAGTMYESEQVTKDLKIRVTHVLLDSFKKNRDGKFLSRWSQTIEYYNKDSGELNSYYYNSFDVNEDGTLVAENRDEAKQIQKLNDKWILNEIGEDSKPKRSEISFDGKTPNFKDENDITDFTKDISTTRRKEGLFYTWDLDENPPKQYPTLVRELSKDELSAASDLLSVENKTNPSIKNLDVIEAQGSEVTRMLVSVDTKTGNAVSAKEYQLSTEGRLSYNHELSPNYNPYSSADRHKHQIDGSRIFSKDPEASPESEVLFKSKTELSALEKNEIALLFKTKNLSPEQKAAFHKTVSEMNNPDFKLNSDGNLEMHLRSRQSSTTRSTESPYLTKYLSQPGDKDLPEDFLLKIRADWIAAKSTKDKILAVRAKVKEIIKTKSIATELSPRECFFVGMGDCSEFSNLSAAIYRQLGIPVRVITGFQISNVEQAVDLGGHAWLEIFVDNKWTAIEPQTGQLVSEMVGNFYLPTAYSTNSKEGQLRHGKFYDFLKSIEILPIVENLAKLKQPEDDIDKAFEAFLKKH